MTNTRSYVEAFHAWMLAWSPDVFATFNVPLAGRAPREEAFYLSHWTRAAEADVLGARTLKITDVARRIVWLCRREVSADDLIHWHAIGKFPVNRPWRNELAYAEKMGTATDVSFRQRMSEHGFAKTVRRCVVLRAALQRASSRTPEPFTLPAADIDVRPFFADTHAPYLLKGMRVSMPDVSMPHTYEFTSADLLRDSGLLILPYLPQPNDAPPRR